MHLVSQCSNCCSHVMLRTSCSNDIRSLVHSARALEHWIASAFSRATSRALANVRALECSRARTLEGSSVRALNISSARELNEHWNARALERCSRALRHSSDGALAVLSARRSLERSTARAMDSVKFSESIILATCDENRQNSWNSTEFGEIRWHLMTFCEIR